MMVKKSRGKKVMNYPEEGKKGSSRLSRSKEDRNELGMDSC